MSITVLRREQSWLARLEGPVTIASAVELKVLLVEWLATGKNLELDLENADEIDITCMQLLTAAARDAGAAGAGIVVRLSAAATAAVHDAGFDQMPAFKVQE